MRIALVEPDEILRGALRELLAELGGYRVYAFADAQVAFLFLLARSNEVAVVVANEDDDATRSLLRRLDVLPASPVPVVYSGRRLEQATTRACGQSGVRRAAPVKVQARVRGSEDAAAASARSSRTSSSPT